MYDMYLCLYTYKYTKQDLMSRNYVAKNANISNLTSRKCDGLDSKGFLTILF